MRTKILFVGVLLVLVSLLTACGLQEPQVSEERIAEIAAQAAKDAIAMIPTPEAVDILTDVEISEIAAKAAENAVAGIEFPEQQIVVEVVMPEVEEPTEVIEEVLVEEPVLSPYFIPISWFDTQGLIYVDGVTVAADCEVGARAWQGVLTFTTVPEDSKIELVEVNCVQYRQGDEIPQSELDATGGLGTIWFLLPIEGTENQKGDCSCPLGEDC